PLACKDRRNKPLIQIDLEIERTIRKLRKQIQILQHITAQQSENSEDIQDNITMAAENTNDARRTLGDYTIPSTASYGSSIVRPTVEANNFELKPSLIQLVQQDQFYETSKRIPIFTSLLFFTYVIH
ncbi:hypothetical protein PIB30_103464, partial [Stylosanthes scabra]|nr:hypothetical protein [Stylosanthes scabra]